jgi:heat shock protein HslJ
MVPRPSDQNLLGAQGAPAVVRRSLISWSVALLQALIVSTAPVAAQPANSLAGSEWRPLEMRNVSVPANTQLRVRFASEGKLTGFSGCNHFFGSYKVTEQKLTFSELGMTRMACPDAIMDLERTFLDALSSTAAFERHRATLTLLGYDGTQIAKFAQTDWD